MGLVAGRGGRGGRRDDEGGTEKGEAKDGAEQSGSWLSHRSCS
jgi:hypothetical protein